MKYVCAFFLQVNVSRERLDDMAFIVSKQNEHYTYTFRIS